jgi:hypothetical protein
MNETSILHLAGGKVTLQARRAVNQSKKPANGKFVCRDNLDFFYYIRWLVFLNLKFVINIDGQLCVKRMYLRPKDLYALGRIKALLRRASNFVRGRKVNLTALYT